MADWHQVSAWMVADAISPTCSGCNESVCYNDHCSLTRCPLRMPFRWRTRQKVNSQSWQRQNWWSLNSGQLLTAVMKSRLLAIVKLFTSRPMFPRRWSRTCRMLKEVVPSHAGDSFIRAELGRTQWSLLSYDQRNNWPLRHIQPFDEVQHRAISSPFHSNEIDPCWWSLIP